MFISPFALLIIIVIVLVLVVAAISIIETKKKKKYSGVKESYTPNNTVITVIQNGIPGGTSVNVYNPPGYTNPKKVGTIIYPAEGQIAYPNYTPGQSSVVVRSLSVVFLGDLTWSFSPPENGQFVVNQDVKQAQQEQGILSAYKSGGSYVILTTSSKTLSPGQSAVAQSYIDFTITNFYVLDNVSGIILNYNINRKVLAYTSGTGVPYIPPDGPKQATITVNNGDAPTDSFNYATIATMNRNPDLGGYVFIGPPILPTSKIPCNPSPPTPGGGGSPVTPGGGGSPVTPPPQCSSVCPANQNSCLTFNDNQICPLPSLSIFNDNMVWVDTEFPESFFKMTSLHGGSGVLQTGGVKVSYISNPAPPFNVTITAITNNINNNDVPLSYFNGLTVGTKLTPNVENPFQCSTTPAKTAVYYTWTDSDTITHEFVNVSCGGICRPLSAMPEGSLLTFYPAGGGNTTQLQVTDGITSLNHSIIGVKDINSGLQISFQVMPGDTYTVTNINPLIKPKGTVLTPISIFDERSKYGRTYSDEFGNLLVTGC